MAQAVRETPVLEGKDAERFEKEIKENENRKVSSEEYSRAQENFEKFDVVL